MAKANSNNNQPSAVIRAFLAEAAEHPHAKDMALNILNAELTRQSMRIEPVVRLKCTEVFNAVAGVRMRPDDRREALASLLIQGDFNPVAFFPLQINRKYTDFSAGDIAALPAYKRIHREAQKADVAVRLIGLTAGERLKPTLVVDISKTYDEGAADSRYGYPDMAPPEAKQLPAPTFAANAPARRNFKI